MRQLLNRNTLVLTWKPYTETSGVGEIETYQSYTYQRTQRRIVETHNTVATTNNAYYAYLGPMEASSDDQSETDCDEGNRASSCQSIRDRGSTPCALLVQADVPPTSESVSKKRKASTPHRNWRDKSVKPSGPKPFIPLQLQNIPGHMKQPAKFLEQVRMDNDINQRRQCGRTELFLQHLSGIYSFVESSQASRRAFCMARERKVGCANTYR
jgi:hypothetical protein